MDSIEDVREKVVKQVRLLSGVPPPPRSVPAQSIWRSPMPLGLPEWQLTHVLHLPTLASDLPFLLPLPSTFQLWLASLKAVL